jgi:hypothetical protein
MTIEQGKKRNSRSNFYYTHYILGWAYYRICRKRYPVPKSLESHQTLCEGTTRASAMKTGDRSGAIKLRDELVSESSRRYLPGYHIAVQTWPLAIRMKH